MTGQNLGETCVSDESQGTDLPETVAIDAQEAESSPAPVEVEETEEPKKVPWFQKRIDETTAQKHDAIRRADAAVAELERLKAEYSARQPEPAVGKPALDNFESYEDYTEALAEWKAEQVLARADQKRQAQEAQTATLREFDSWNDRLNKAAATNPKLLELVNEIGYQVTPEMGKLIRTRPNGPDIVAYLGEHRDELARIASLPADEAIYEMGRLSTALTPVEKPKRNQPPAPITPWAEAARQASSLKP